MWKVWNILQKQEGLWRPRGKQTYSKVDSNNKHIFWEEENMFHPRILGLDGRLKSKKEIEGLNKVLKNIIR